MEKYYLGIDNGSSSVKVGLYSASGEELGISHEDVPFTVPQSGYCERDMNVLWEANCRAIREVIRKTGIDPSEIEAVAGCGHGKGLYLWGEDGAIFPGILSSDNRGLPYVRQWQQDGTDAWLFEKTQQHMLVCHPVAMLSWVRDHAPEVIPKVRHIFTCKDYIRFRLTGTASGEITECCGWGVMDARTMQYDDEILKRLGLEMFRDAFPPIRRPKDICGTVSAAAAAECGLAEGTPVAGGLFDIGASAIALNAVNEENLCMIAGTWSINEYIRRDPIMDGSVLMNSVFYEPGKYLIEESSPTSCANYQWFTDHILEESRTGEADGTDGEKSPDTDWNERMNRWAGSVGLEEDIPVFLPFVSGSNANPDAAGAFVGLRARHSIRHLARSVFEGIVFSHRYHLDKLFVNYPGRPREIHLAGGAAKSPLWVQMFADVCGFPVRTSGIEETGTLGCAIVAAIAAGEYETLDEAIRKMVRLSGLVEPDPEHSRYYDRKYQKFRSLIDALDSWWE